MHLKTSFWKGSCRLLQTIKGAHSIKTESPLTESRRRPKCFLCSACALALTADSGEWLALNNLWKPNAVSESAQWRQPRISEILHPASTPWKPVRAKFPPYSALMHCHHEGAHTGYQKPFVNLISKPRMARVHHISKFSNQKFPS